MALIEYFGIGTEKGEDVIVKTMSVDKKTGESKMLGENNEKKKQKKLFKHLFEASNYRKPEKKQKKDKEKK